MASKTPSYRQRTGYTQAIVTLTDAQTRKRREPSAKASATMYLLHSPLLFR